MDVNNKDMHAGCVCATTEDGGRELPLGLHQKQQKGDVFGSAMRRPLVQMSANARSLAAVENITRGACVRTTTCAGGSADQAGTLKRAIAECHTNAESLGGK